MACLKSALFFKVVPVDCGQKSMDILIFGGNGFIGSHIVEKLIENRHKITLINRNHWPWDTSTTIRSKVFRNFILDRLDMNSAENFRNQVINDRITSAGNQNIPFDLVIDLSAYTLSALKPFYDILVENRLCKLYVFVSTDSVYEVCQIDRRSNQFLKETDAIRPTNISEAEKMNALDSYGHRKLQIEEFLRRRESSKNGLPYLILRLPDVLGERDSTKRWWKYQMWIENFRLLDTPIVIPDFARNLKTSYVYVKDVAKLVALICEYPKAQIQSSKIIDKVYNFAYPEAKSLTELLVHINQATNVRRVDMTKASDAHQTKDNTFYFPSVTLGALDISAFGKNFPNFVFTPWEEMVHNIAGFYKKSSKDFPRERDETASSLCRDIGVEFDVCNKLMTYLLVDAEKKFNEDL
uniref:NAD-dependent epimerase/dehydratase domain-containing protein n=1 Tax=Romanomermis culicivorax TaxID=13658 RepID=A0A915L5T5_ROMCU